MRNQDRPRSLNKCQAKRRYESRAFALCAAVISMGEFNTRPLRAFQCEWCVGWHLTHVEAKAA